MDNTKFDCARNTINQRLVEVFEDGKYKSLSAFSRAVNFPRTNVHSYLYLNRVPKFEFIVNLKQLLPHLSLEWLFTGIGIKYLNGKNENPETSDSQITFYIPTDNPNDPTGLIKVPNIIGDSFIPCIGCSMPPTISPGNIVGIKKINDWDIFDPDKVYMVITRHNQRMLKHIKCDNEDENILWLKSENNDTSFKLSKSDIMHIYHVIGRMELL